MAQEPKAHITVDTPGHLLAVLITPANEQDRARVGEPARRVEAVAGKTVEVAWVDQGYTGEEPAAGRGTAEQPAVAVPGYRNLDTYKSLQPCH